MPLLIRIIAQRIAISALGFLTFLGINPDIHVPTIEEVEIVEQNQQKIVEEILTPNIKEQEKVVDTINKIAEGLNKTETNVQNKIEQVINVPKIQRGEDNLIEAKANFYENVVVNILCINKTKTNIKMTTGSGVIISSSGLVLTNTHVANNFLFDNKSKDSYKECTIRRENIPTYGFNAEPVYMSEEWFRDNQSFFSSSNPKGDGQNDYAILAITTNTNPALRVPTNFDYARVITNEDILEKGKTVTVAAYPGIHTGVFEVDSNGKLKQSKTFISELMTFDSDSIDVISTGPNEVAKKGSSGGGVFNGQDLIGIVVTTDSNSEGSYINAITLPYIVKDFSKDTGENFKEYISGDKKSLISEYSDDINNLKNLVADFI
jgi:hypothetical protein